MCQFVSVCRTEEIAEGSGKLCLVGGRQLAIFRLQDRFYALANQCPHAGASLAHGLIQDGTVRCRIHHWRFRICDGTYLDEDRPACNVPSFRTRVVLGEVQVECGG